ncbi:hypothetical protein [Lactobacillus sp. LL6]|uniref:hypothetical protein n=1 Tax=Lactobacillus sp. LL6 TaxID=2596827 RepID=UPI0011856F5E|nr:hypothetical protein [Lactobacillus sp. LL6]TSO26663.1 hypothetical protein FOD82_06270 [Lactobacillus sp. LL6]
MWSVSKVRLTNLINSFLKNANLTATRILHLYTYILFFIPLAFAALIELQSLLTKVSFADLLKSPFVSISVIVAFCDFLLGYYLWINKDKVLLRKTLYKNFMIIQAISQMLVGNFVCGVLAIAGIYQAKEINGQEITKTDKIIKISSIVMLVIFVMCFVMLLMASLRK